MGNTTATPLPMPKRDHFVELPSPNTYSELTELHRLARENKIDQDNIQNLINVYSIDYINAIYTGDYNPLGEHGGGKYREVTPLHVALINGKREAVLFLVANGAKVDDKFWMNVKVGDGYAHSYTTPTTFVFAKSHIGKWATPILSGGPEYAKQILRDENLLNDEKLTKAAKH